VVGEIGAGKTTFVRGAARELGVTGRVTSPTFTIGRRYPGTIPVSHLDLHRLAGLEAEDPALLADYLTDDAIAFVEWPEIAEPRLERVAVVVSLAHAGGDERTVAVAWTGDASASRQASSASETSPQGEASP
jgi:tRNA threonylcarbamoyladenosine biosynthesis protein TsaE